MNSKLEFLLKGFRKVIAKKLLKTLDIPSRCMDADKTNDMIYDLLMADKPCMIARYGSCELNVIINYLGGVKHKNEYLKYVLGKVPAWWNFIPERWQSFQYNAGFFPLEQKLIEKWCQLSIDDSRQVDMLGSWCSEEHFMAEYNPTDMKRCALLLLEPYWGKRPWSRALEGKKVLVIHPFAELIERQYNEKREVLFENKEVLPPFELKTIKAVSAVDGRTNFNNWFEALEHMERQMDATDYDVCLIGAGAYGFNLAAHAKRMGKKAVHLGGALQLLFGIRGKRWDNPEYGKVTLKGGGKYLQLFNENWVYPGEEYRPKNGNCCDDNCYWK